MATNSTDEDPGSPTFTREKVSAAPSAGLIGDPVFLAITGVILCFAIIFLVREIVSRVKDRRYNHHHHHHRNEDPETVPRPVPSQSRFTDDPPPYPGKYSKTNVNYLPSYDSAIKMAPELQFGNIDEMMTSVLDENSDDNSELTSDHTDHQEDSATGVRIQSLSQSSICNEMDYDTHTDDDDDGV